MTWQQRYRLRNFLKSALWLIPLLGMIAGMVVSAAVIRIDRVTGWRWANFGLQGSRAAIEAFTAALLTLIVFVFSSLLLVVQLASAQLTPRIITLVFKDRATKISLGFFVFTYTYSLVTLGRTEDKVPQLAVLISGICSLISIGLFLYLIDRVAMVTRPVSVLTSVATKGLKVIEEVYPQLLTEESNIPANVKGFQSFGQPLVLNYEGPPRILLAFDEEGLVEVGQRENCLIELVPEVGDSLASGDPLFNFYGVRRELNESELLGAVAFGSERTLEQDPIFAFRIMVDIASKALSPAINDPTTAVLALDQIQHLLRQVGMRRLDTGRVSDKTGQLRLIYRTPDWGDFLFLGVTEIRQFGEGCIQVVRRLRAMLENLDKALPPERTALIGAELEMLNRSVERTFPDREDRMKGNTSDLQGLGGSSRSMTGRN
jgi:uncharacterized membrane protein